MYLSNYPPTYSFTHPPIRYPLLIHPSIYASNIILFIFSSFNPPTHSTVYLSIHLPIHLLDIHYQPTHLAIYLSIHSSTCPSICLSIHPSTYLPTHHLPIIYPIFLTLSICLSTYSVIRAPVLFRYPSTYPSTYRRPPHSPQSFILFQLGWKVAGIGMRDSLQESLERVGHGLWSGAQTEVSRRDGD